MRSQQRAHLFGGLPRAPGALEPGLELDRIVEGAHFLDLDPGVAEERAPLRLGVVANVRRVAQLVGALGGIVHEEVVDDDHARPGNTAELAGRGGHVGEVVCCDTRDREVEPGVGEGQLLGEADDVGPHPGSRVAADDLEPCLREAAGHMAASGRDVDGGMAPLGPLDDQVEVGALAVRLARAVQIRAIAPGLGHSASSTAS